MMPLSTIGKQVKSFSHLMSSQVIDESKFEFTYVRIPDSSFASTLGLKTGSIELKFASLIELEEAYLKPSNSTHVHVLRFL